LFMLVTDPMMLQRQKGAFYMKNGFKILTMIFLLFFVSGCSKDLSKEEPHLRYTRTSAEYTHQDKTLEQLFEASDLVIMGTVTNGNLTGVKEIPSDQPVTEKDDILAEVMITGLYKGNSEDWIQVKQKYGDAFYVTNGYLKYNSSYLLFLKKLSNQYTLLSPECRYEVIDGALTPTLASSKLGVIKTLEDLTAFLENTVSH